MIPRCGTMIFVSLGSRCATGKHAITIGPLPPYVGRLANELDIKASRNIAAFRRDDCGGKFHQDDDTTPALGLPRCVVADFRATGRTGIMIAGEPVPIDPVAADFLSGAVERL